METGFYHADRGYWQTTGQPTAEILATYPDGTVSVPLKPGENYQFNGAAWALVAPPVTGDQVNAERDRRIQAGAEFTLSGNFVIAITGREQDKVALLGRAAAAQKLKDQNVTAAVLIYRDRENVNRTLTPDQMIELYELGLTWVEAMMVRSWEMKDGTGAFSDGIPSDFNEDSHWPEPVDLAD